jgi:hypothetical protein
VGVWPGGAIVASLAMLASTAGAQTRVRARVLDHGDTGTGVVSAAETIVDRAYARAGVTFAWQSCDPSRDPSTDACVGPAGPNDVSIRIVDREPRTENPGAEIQGGCAIPLRLWAASGIVYVYSDRVRRVSDEGGVPAALVLGTIVAHEIGHLLLPGGHSPRGIMRALMTRREWILAQQGRLWFTPIQSDFLKASGQRGAAAGLADFNGGSQSRAAYSQGGQSGWD